MVTIKTGETTHLRGSLTQQVSAPPSQPTQPTSPTTPTPPVSTSSSTTSLSFYAEGKFQAGMMMGAGASVGAYIYGLNVEGTFLLGLAESEEIAWRQTSQSGNSGYSYTYKPMFYGLKLGYRIPSESKFRFTPQVGIGVASISGSQVQKGSGTDPGATSCYAVPASVGVRLEYNISKNFGVSASPEFSFPVMKSDTYTKLSDLSSKVKGFGSGFNARVGLFVSF
jgi:outer membrane autotransporter protein